jgi:polygalacturonase
MKNNFQSCWLFLLTIIPVLVFADSSVTAPNPKLYSDAVRADFASTASGKGMALVGYVPAGASSVASTVQVKLGEVVSVKDYGAVANGVTDDAPAFRKAIAYLTTRGGGTLLMPAGSYFLDSFDSTPVTQDENAAFVLTSGVILKGESNNSTSLKMSATLQSRMSTGMVQGGGRINFIGVKSGAVGAVVRDINFDYNGIVLKDLSFRSYNAVRSAGNDILIERIRVINAPGRNMVVATSGATVRESVFTNGNQNVAGNTAAIDSSFIYLNGKDNLVENNVFSNTVTAVSNSGGVEVHATNSKVLNNKFVNLYPAIYDGVQGGTVAYNNQIKGNYFENCKGGIVAVDKHRGWIIADNHFVDSNVAPMWAIMTSRDDITGVASAGVQENVTIENNTFETIHGDPQRPYIRVAGFQNSVIKGNNFNGNICPVCLMVSTTETKNVSVTDNLFKNPPSSRFAYGQVHLSGDNNGKWGGAFTNILVKNNRFLNDKALPVPSNIYPFSSSGTGSITFTNNKALDNQIENMNVGIGGPAGRWQLR